MRRLQRQWGSYEVMHAPLADSIQLMNRGVAGLSDTQRIGSAIRALRDEHDAAKALKLLCGRTETAFLVATMDVHTQKIISTGVFSEATPTQNLRDHRLFVVTRADAATFAEARRKLLKTIAAVNPATNEGWYDWALPLMRGEEHKEVTRLRGMK